MNFQSGGLKQSAPVSAQTDCDRPAVSGAPIVLDFPCCAHTHILITFRNTCPPALPMTASAQIFAPSARTDTNRIQMKVQTGALAMEIKSRGARPQISQRMRKFSMWDADILQHGIVCSGGPHTQWFCVMRPCPQTEKWGAQCMRAHGILNRGGVRSQGQPIFAGQTHWSRPRL
jgi:hypothetical protein